jgi:UDP-glucose 4-epimerase
MLEGIKCLVIGGGGFIGTHLCQTLTKYGAIVTGFGRRQSYPNALQNISWAQGSFSDQVILKRAIEDNQIIFHLLSSGIRENANKNSVLDLMNDVNHSINLFDLCCTSNVRKIIFVSSGGTVYGIQSPIHIPETAQTNPISPYGISKLAIEKYLNLYHHMHGLNYTILRVANPYGPFQDPARKQGVVAALLHKLKNDQAIEIWGNGEAIRDFIYIDDVIEALTSTIHYNGPHRIFNVGSGVGRSVRQVIEDIQLVLGKSAIEKIYQPERTTDVPANVLDIGLIHRELGWMPRTQWMQGLQLTAEWMGV